MAHFLRIAPKRETVLNLLTSTRWVLAFWLLSCLATHAQTTWTSQTAASTNVWQSVTYGNGVFVAISQYGPVMTSPDGVTWTSRTAASTSVWSSVTYGNGVFVAVSYDGKVMTSPNGSTWTSRTAASNNQWSSVTYGNGVFVAVSSSGKVMTSPDGITWTNQIAATNDAWYSVTYGNGVFVAVSQDSKVMKSVASALPVTLINFQAKTTTQNSVQLNWTTSLETDNKGFQLDRSKDLIHFETVGQIPAEAANSQAIKHYQFTDQTPFTGTSYYRLTQTDLSGKATVYPAVSVVIREDAYGVYPNPVVSEGGFVLRLDEPQTAILGFFSPQGRAIPLQKMGLQSGNLLLKASGSLATGVYVLTVEERGQTRQHRLVVQ